MKKVFIVTNFIIVLFASTLFAQEGKQIEIKDFTEFKLEGSGTVYLIQSDSNKLFIDVKSCDIINYLDIDNKGEKLVVNTTSKNKKLTKTFSKLVIYVYCKDLNTITLEGKGKIITKDTLTADVFSVISKGTGGIKVLVNCNFLRAELNGTGNIHVKGVSKESKVNVNGVGVYKALDFITEDTDVTVEGVGSAYVYASKRLKASLSGVGSIKYLGNPKQINCDASGVGGVKPYKY